MTVTFLGTGTSQGVPVIACDCPVCMSLDWRDKRLRSSVHLQLKETSLVIDTGPDFRQQMLRERITHLDGVLFTHEHKDHTAGMDDIRSYNFKQHQDMPIYGRKSVIMQIKKEFAYVFAKDKYPGTPQVAPVEIKNAPFKIKGVEITPIEALHHKLRVFGFRIGDFTYITDASRIEDKEKAKITGSRVLVLNALRREAHVSHFTLDEATDLALELGAEQTYFTHISHLMGSHREVSEQLPEGIDLAWDGLKVHMD